MIGWGQKLDNACDLEKQTFYRFIRQTYILHPIALALVLYSIGGFPYFIWGTVKKITSIIVNLIPFSYKSI